MAGKSGAQSKKKSHNSNESPKPRGNPEVDEEQLNKKKGDRKGKKSASQEEKASSSNGVATHNGKKEKNKNAKRSNSYHEKSAQSSGWSTLAYVNVFLLMIALTLSGSLLFLCSNGDFSMAGVKSSWPCIQQNAHRLRNISMEVINKENLMEVGHIAWLTSLKGFEKLLATAKVFLAFASESLQRWAKELSPYTEPLMPYIFEITNRLHCAFNWVTDSENWSTVYNFLSWIATCIVEQLIVLKEELRRNVALTSICEKVDNWSVMVWNSTSSLRSTVLTLYTNASSQWLPYYTNQASNLVSSLRSSIENFLK